MTSGCAWCGVYWDKPLDPEEPELYCSPQCVVSACIWDGTVVSKAFKDRKSWEVIVKKCYLDRRTWGMGETIYYREAK